MEQPSRAEIAKKLGVSWQRVHQLIEAGQLPRQGTLKDYVAANDKRLSSDNDQLDLTYERARVAKAQADKLELEMQVRRGELLEREVVEAALVDIAAKVKNKVVSIPTRAAPLVVGRTTAEAEQAIRTITNETLRELAGYAECIEVALDDLRATT